MTVQEIDMVDTDTESEDDMYDIPEFLRNRRSL